MKCVLCTLKSQHDVCFSFKVLVILTKNQDFVLKAFTNADWEGSVDD